mmetsp:Transcript_13465/g.40618  ORF Transcript_13465/g.40618 Transcript_13465/m.40618 type:complete len:287 (+) Transcript_13465:947-1807(+)
MAIGARIVLLLTHLAQDLIQGLLSHGTRSIAVPGGLGGALLRLRGGGPGQECAQQGAHPPRGPPVRRALLLVVRALALASFQVGRHAVERRCGGQAEARSATLRGGSALRHPPRRDAPTAQSRARPRLGEDGLRLPRLRPEEALHHVAPEALGIVCGVHGGEAPRVLAQQASLGPMLQALLPVPSLQDVNHPKRVQSRALHHHRRGAAARQCRVRRGRPAVGSRRVLHVERPAWHKAPIHDAHEQGVIQQAPARQPGRVRLELVCERVGRVRVEEERVRHVVVQAH